MRNFLLLLVIGIIHTTISQDFGYDGDNGPEHWGEHYGACVGKEQSPIDIDPNHIVKKVLPKLQFEGFDAPPREMKLTNNGHTVQLTVDGGSLPKITGGPLNGVYEFAQLHFHWGDNDTFGSEDTIEGRRFPMELHVVFYKLDYQTTKNALDHKDGLAVLAFFYEVYGERNEKYDEFVEHVSQVQNPKEVAYFQDIPTFFDLLPIDLVHYYTYNGSLTTPPCSEVVTWIDFKQPVFLSHDQLEAFRHIQDHHGKALTHNFRPVQPLGDREVWYNLDEFEYDKEVDLSHETPYETDIDNNELGVGEIEKINRDKENSATRTSFKLSLVSLICTILYKLKIF